MLNTVEAPIWIHPSWFLFLNLISLRNEDHKQELFSEVDKYEDQNPPNAPENPPKAPCNKPQYL